MPSKLKELHTKPLSKFSGTAHAASDLLKVATFLGEVADTIRQREAA
jgi:hypothetical protein